MRLTRQAKIEPQPGVVLVRLHDGPEDGACQTATIQHARHGDHRWASGDIIIIHNDAWISLFQENLFEYALVATKAILAEVKEA